MSLSKTVSYVSCNLFGFLHLDEETRSLQFEDQCWHLNRGHNSYFLLVVLG